MDKLRAIRVFVRLSELGSYTALAEEMQVSKSAVSKEITKLEESVGARLLQRSSRQFIVTTIGKEYLLRCSQILKMVEDSDAMIHQLQLQARGCIRVNAPMALGILRLPELFAEFIKQYPGIDLDICFDDRSLDLVQGGYDVAFRASSLMLEDNYFGKPLAKFKYKVVSSVEYVSDHPKITSESDLTQHKCFVYSYFKGNNCWPLGGGVEVKSSIKVNSTIFMLRLIEQGLGVGFMPDFVCEDSLNGGRSIELLPDLRRPELTLYVLYPSHNHISYSVRLLIDFSENWFKKNRENGFSQALRS